ncbi:MAG: paraquat-inducible membrane protein A [Deltaproteobacteria bacterium]|nr:MAG: paraquat-inducible membrane protein A [Deltaproteobacteria bacterium]
MNNYQIIRGIEKSMSVCPLCGKLNKFDMNETGKTRCSRCHKKIDLKKKDSLLKTWALVISALILYIPANIYPMVYYSSMGEKSGDTILSGVYSLMETGLWPLAIIVFTASIAIPLMKIILLIFLLISSYYNHRFLPVMKTKIYIFVKIIGKWSMLDVFLISLMTAIVKLGKIADVVPGEAVRYFTAVVILTLLASMTFDPKTIWNT